MQEGQGQEEEVTELGDLAMIMRAMGGAGQDPRNIELDPRIMQREKLLGALVNNAIHGHRNLNFVDRLLYPENYPVIRDDPRLPDGWHATHQMSWSDDGRGFYYAYPNIIWDKKAKKLKWLDGDEAKKYALETGEYIPFKSADDAEMFTSQYKRFLRRAR